MNISIITATFNSGATVRDTLESVMRQTHSDWELIIKDGGSKDNTLDICREIADNAAGRIWHAAANRSGWRLLGRRDPHQAGEGEDLG